MPVMTTPGVPLAVMRVTIIWAVRAHAAALSPRALLFTWLGALAFFFSLAYFLFSYLTTFGEPASGGGIAARAYVERRALYGLRTSPQRVRARTRARGDCARRYLSRSSDRFTSGSRASCSSRSARCGGRCRASRGSVDGPLVWGLRAVQAAGVWLTLRSAVVLDIRDLAGLRAAGGGADRIQDVGTLRLGAAPDLYRLVSDGLRRVADDDDQAGVCGGELCLPARGDSVRGALDARRRRPAHTSATVKQVPWRPGCRG